MRALIACAVLVFALGALPALAQDAPSCAVLPFEGSSAVVVRRSVMRALEDDGTVSVLDETIVDEASEGGASPHVVASRTGADLVIAGDVEGRGARRRLSLQAYDADGNEIATAEIRLRSGGAGRRALDDGIADLLAAALPHVGRDDEPAEVAVRPEPERPRRERTEPSAPASFGPDPRIVSVRLGAVIRSREAETEVELGLPRSWRSSPAYVELWAGAEIRPLARSGDYARGLFLRGEFAAAIGLGSRDERGGTVSTEFFRAAGDAGYLVPIGEVVEVGGAFGVGLDAYHLGDNTLYPGVELVYLRPAARARFRALGESLVAFAELGYRGVVARDGISGAFGGGDSHGIDVGGGISGTIELGPDVGGIAYGVEAAWVGIWHSFDGSGALAPGVSGSEQGFRILVSAGWAI